MDLIYTILSDGRQARFVTELEEKGLARSWMGEPAGERGGKAKRHFEVRPEGVQALEASRAVRERMWEPVLTSMFIVASGFAIFFFSSFPPTQRFGGQIVLGTVISAFSAIFIFSLLAQPRGKPHKAHPRAAPPAPFSRLAKFRDS